MLIAEGQGPKRKKATVTNDNVAVVHDLVRTYVASHGVCFTNIKVSASVQAGPLPAGHPSFPTSLSSSLKMSCYSV